MASLDSLSEDQRAVLSLVLQRGRSYDDIARLLSIDRTAVRQRALTAFDALGPQTGVSDQRRALITDYLLGQLPPPISQQTRDRLAESANERAWARVVASEVAAIASGSLPEIPVEGSSAPAAAPGPDEAPRAIETPVADGAQPEAAPEPPKQRRVRQSIFKRKMPKASRRPASARTSRRGGLALILAVVVVAAVVVFVFNKSGSSNTPIASTATSTSALSSTTASHTATSSSAAHVVAQINLAAPTAGSKVAGIAEVLKEDASNGIAIVAQNIPPNAAKPPNAYAVWLYNSPTDAHILGFVNPGVGASGRLSTAGGLPANASRYKDLIVTVETKASPTSPGPIILQGALTGLS